MRLSGQEYVDIYATKAKAELEGARKAGRSPRRRGRRSPARPDSASAGAVAGMGGSRNPRPVLTAAVAVGDGFSRISWRIEPCEWESLPAAATAPA